MNSGAATSLKHHRFGGDDMHQRAGLHAGEYRFVDGFASSWRQRMNAPRGPRKVLCVVLVTTSA